MKETEITTTAFECDRMAHTISSEFASIILRAHARGESRVVNFELVPSRCKTRVLQAAQYVSAKALINGVPPAFEFVGFASLLETRS